MIQRSRAEGGRRTQPARVVAVDDYNGVDGSINADGQQHPGTARP